MMGTAPQDHGARAAGDADAVTEQLTAAFTAARAAGDTPAMAAAALALPLRQRFGVHPGQVPALMHEAYTVAEDPTTRCRLAAALARSWVYGGDGQRANRFAEEAVRLAVELAVPALLADALDAGLVAHWGPDDFTERVSMAARLDETAAHLTDSNLRLQAHLWRLTTAWECLDIVAVHRQLRALDLLAGESSSPRVAFFAVSRQAMHALATGDLALVDELILRAEALGTDAGEPDAEAVIHSLNSGRARQRDDLVALRAEAQAYDVFSTHEGVPSIAAEAAVLWLAAGDPERAGVLAEQLVAGGFDAIAHDVDFLLITTCVVAVAADLGRRDITAAGLAALEPYAGRGVLNAGAVSFHGVVDDYLYRAASLLDHPSAEHWRAEAERAYRRIGANWWQHRVAGRSPLAAPVQIVHLHPNPDGDWTVGPQGGTFRLDGSKGLQYLRELVRRPGVDITAVALSDLAAGHPGEGISNTDLGETLDPKALSAYRRRLAQLEAELDEADVRGDKEMAERCHAERTELLRQVRSATGLGGRQRRTGATDERARTAVRKALAAAFSRIEPHDPGLARLLRDTIRTGTTCRYDPQPDRPITWRTE